MSVSSERVGKGAPARPWDLSGRGLAVFFFVLLAVSTAVRVLVSVFPKTAYTYNDELFYLELAQNIWLRGSLSVYGAPIRFTKILYPALISPFYAVGDGMLRARLISGFNALLLSSSLIPGGLLARRVLKKNLYAALAMLVLALSPNLLFSVTFMAENLYYPLLLWAMYAVFRFLSAEERTLAHALLLGFLAFLLYLVKETGAAFLFALVPVLLSARSFPRFLFGAVGFGIPYLALKLTVFRDVGYSYARQVSLAGLSGAPQLTYLLYCLALMVLFFLLSTLWFPVALPFARRGMLAPRDRRFLLFSSLYAGAVIAGIVFGVLLHTDRLSAAPRVHMRYLLGAAYPFLLLFFAAFDGDGPAVRNRFLPAAAGVFALAVLLFTYIPEAGSLVDHPVFHFLHPLGNRLPWAVWAVRGLTVLLSALVLFLLRLQKRNACLCVLFASMIVLELLGGVSFLKDARRAEKVSDASLLQETEELDRLMDGLEGNVLLVVPGLHRYELKLLNTVSGDDYAVAEQDTLFRLFEKEEKDGQDGVSPAGIPIPYPEFSLRETYGMASVDYLVTLGTWSLVDPARTTDMTPENFSSYHIFRPADASVLPLLAPDSCVPGEPILFYGDDPQYRYYHPTGLSVQESGYVWSDGPEVSFTLRPRVDEPRDLMVTWTWKMTNGEQPCEIFANDLSVRTETLSSAEKNIIFYVPAECWAGSGELTLRFVFPEAREPGNGDRRRLAVAFESLTLGYE